MSNVPVYFRFFIDDYIRDAEELSPMQHGLYLRLMLWYYARAKPIPNDLQRIYTRTGAKSREEEGAVRSILSEFFELRDGFWWHKRIEAELEHWRARSDAARLSTAAREQKRLQNNTRESSNDVQTINERSSNQNQSSSKTKAVTPDAIESWTDHWTAKGKALGITAKRGESTGDYCRRVMEASKIA